MGSCNLAAGLAAPAAGALVAAGAAPPGRLLPSPHADSSAAAPASAPVWMLARSKPRRLKFGFRTSTPPVSRSLTGSVSPSYATSGDPFLHTLRVVSRIVIVRTFLSQDHAPRGGEALPS